MGSLGGDRQKVVCQFVDLRLTLTVVRTLVYGPTDLTVVSNRCVEGAVSRLCFLACVSGVILRCRLDANGEFELAGTALKVWRRCMICPVVSNGLMRGVRVWICDNCKSALCRGRITADGMSFKATKL